MKFMILGLILLADTWLWWYIGTYIITISNQNNIYGVLCFISWLIIGIISFLVLFAKDIKINDKENSEQDY